MSNKEELTITVLVNYPRLDAFYDDPIEAIIRRRDGSIVHNIFATTSYHALGLAEDWVKDNGYAVGAFTRFPDVKYFEQVFNLGWRIGRRADSLAQR